MATGTVTDSAGRVWPANSNSCADMLAAFTAANRTLGGTYTAVSCTSDPVVVGTTVNFIPSGSWTVSAITATATPPPDTGGTGGTGTTTGTVSMGSGTLTLTVKVEPAPPSAERIQDLSLLFGLSIVFLVSVTGAKQLLQLFQVNHEKD